MITAVNHMHPSLGGAPLILPGQKKGGGGGFTQLVSFTPPKRHNGISRNFNGN